MGTASVEGEVDFICLVVIIEGIFHLIAVEIIFTVGNDFRRVDFDFFFAEGFDDERGLYFIFGFKIEDLPRGSREKAVVSRVDAVFRRVGNLRSDGFGIFRLVLRNFVFFDNFARKGVPEKNLFAGFVGRKSHAARDKFLDSHSFNITYLEMNLLQNSYISGASRCDKEILSHRFAPSAAKSKILPYCPSIVRIL